MRAKILLVGGTGYLGQHLLQHLQGDFNIWLTGTQLYERENYYQVDFTNETTYENLKGSAFDMIMILASTITGIGQVNLNHRDLDVNVWGYKKFLQFIGDNALTSKIVYISSMTVYGPENDVPVKETGLIKPFSVYGLSKSIAETLTIFFSNQNGIRTIILRIPGLFGGERKRGFIYNVVRDCLAKKDITLNSSGLGYWECVEVNDLCAILKDFFLEYSWNKQNDIFNVGYGEEIDFIHTAYRIRDFVNSGSMIFEVGEKGYVKFFLSNEKFKELVPISYDFNSALRKYIEYIQLQ